MGNPLSICFSSLAIKEIAPIEPTIISSNVELDDEKMIWNHCQTLEEKKKLIIFKNKTLISYFQTTINWEFLKEIVYSLGSYIKKPINDQIGEKPITLLGILQSRLEENPKLNELIEIIELAQIMPVMLKPIS